MNLAFPHWYNEKMVSSNDDWLQARHNKWNTPPDLLNEYVRKATGGAIAHASRMVAGVDNEVYDVTSDMNQQFIVRISHKANHRFEGERWALCSWFMQRVRTQTVFNAL